jgi:hypothetical protein
MNKTLFYGIFLSAILVSGTLGFSFVFADQDDAKNKGKLGLTISGPTPNEALIDSKIKVVVAATSSTNNVDDLVDDLHLKWMSKNGGTIINQNTDWNDGDAIDENSDANIKQTSFEITADQPGQWEVWIQFTKDGKIIESKHQKFNIIGAESSLEKPPQISTEIIQMSLTGTGGPIIVPPPGDKGEKGDKGDPGEQGPQGETGLDDLIITQRENSVFIQERGTCPVAPGCEAETRQVQTVSVDCLSNEIVTGGGWFHTIDLAKVFVSENRQVGNGWQVTAFNSANGDAGVTFTVYAECLQQSSP